MKIGIIQLSKTSNVEQNRQKLADEMRRVAAQGAELIVNQELHDSLYFCQHEDIHECNLALPIPGEATEFYSSLAKELGVVIVTSLFEKRAPGLYHNLSLIHI
mgnify:FL=1